MRICVIGAGLAGSLLTWRLASVPGVAVELVLGTPGAPDATAASGGGVRGYEPHPEQRLLAVDSLAELLGSAVLREWAGYVSTGAVYVRAEGVTCLPAELADLDSQLPGSAELVDATALAALGWAALPSGVTAVYERHAGYLDPDRLRRRVLADLAARSSVMLLDAATEQVVQHEDGLVSCLGSGGVSHYDAVVIAAGAWTPRLLHDSGLPATAYRTKSIQCSIYPADGWRPPAFVDETCGLYGRPTANGGLLLGVPSNQWDVPAGPHPATPALHDEAVRLAGMRFPELRLRPATSRITATDCYTTPPILALRPVGAVNPRLFTFTGGSGGSAKTALAASRRAANQLIRVGMPQDTRNP